MRLFLQTTLGILALDQATKWIVVHVFNLRSLGVIEVWPPYLTFRMAWNEGINFGLGGNLGGYTRWILIAVALAISAWVVVWARRETGNVWVQLAAGLLVGGAIGNVIDRLVYGAVADFLNMSCCGIANPYAFNVADIAIFLGAFGLILASGRGKSS